MRFVPLEVESNLRGRGLWPQSRTAHAALSLVPLSFFLFAVHLLPRLFSSAFASSLSGWVSFLSGLSILLLAILGFRWLRSQLLWRLRNRLIVTYVFIGVIPVLLLFVISFVTLYLLSGQF